MLIPMAVPKYSSTLRKVSAFHDLPSLVSPKRLSNPPSYTWTRPPAGERIPDESLLPLISPLWPEVTYNRITAESINSWLSNLPESNPYDMFQFSEKHWSAPSSPGFSPSSWTPTPRIGPWWMRPRKCGLIAGLCLLSLYLTYLLSSRHQHGVGLSFILV